MTFRELMQALRRFWPLVLFVFALCLSVGLAAAFLPAKRYTATATMYAEPASTRALDFGGQQALEFLLPTVLRAVETRSFSDDVRGNIVATSDADFDLMAVNEPGTAIFFV